MPHHLFRKMVEHELEQHLAGGKRSSRHSPRRDSPRRDSHSKPRCRKVAPKTTCGMGHGPSVTNLKKLDKATAAAMKKTPDVARELGMIKAALAGASSVNRAREVFAGDDEVLQRLPAPKRNKKKRSLRRRK